MTEIQRKEVIKKILRISPWYEEKDITENTLLYADLDYDSLDFSELLVDLESSFNIKISPEEWFNSEVTIGKVFKLIESNISDEEDKN